MNAAHKLLCAPLEQILISGGDMRSAINEHTGLNSFGCTPFPRPAALSFGSSTASSISQHAFCHAENERERLLQLFAHSAIPPNDVLDAQTERQRSELKHLLGLEQSGVEIIFSPSGTDATLHALFLVRALYDQSPLDCIMLASDETGSGVPNALSGRHFNTMTAEGISTTKGEPITGLSEDVTLLSLPVRTQEGSLRVSATMDEEILAAVARSVAAGRLVLLQVMDSSKLGVRYPGPDCLQNIQRQFANSVTIVVDACQMRLSRPRLQWHLAQGHLVLISGSKFFTGPPFSGALLVPASLAAPLQTVRTVPLGLQDYTNRNSWPQTWKSIRAALPESANWGQYFRWAAALAEMRAYFSIPASFRLAALQQFADSATALIRSRHPDLSLLPDSLLEDRSDTLDPDGDAEMGIRTIFPFLLRRGKKWMSFEEATKLYNALNQNLAPLLPAASSQQERLLAAKLCHIGQPVSIASGEGKQRGALRICASARTVSTLWYQNHRQTVAASWNPDGLNRAIHEAMQAMMQETCEEIETILAKSALICRHFDLLTGSARNNSL